MLKKVYPILPWVQVRTTAVKEDSSFEVSMFRKPPTRRLIDLILLFMPSATALVLHSVGNLIRCAEAAIDQSANVANVANPIKHLDELYRKPKTGSDPMPLLEGLTQCRC